MSPAIDRLRPTLLLAFLPLAVYAAHTALLWDHINDDAYITFRYSHFLANGYGPIYNLGEHVEGYTNFLLMLLIAGVIAIFGDAAAPTAAKIIGVTGGAVALLLGWDLCRRWLGRLPALADRAAILACPAALLVAISPSFAVNSTSGLETALFSAALLAGVWAHQAARDASAWRGCGVFLALAALTRPEGIACAVILLVARLALGEFAERGSRRRLFLDAVIFGLVVVAHSTFRYFFYDGEFVPNTYLAKVGGVTQFSAVWGYVFGFAKDSLGVLLALLAFLPLAGRARQEAIPSLAIVLAMALAVFKTGTDWMIGWRICIPYLPLWTALAVCGIATLLSHYRRDPQTAAFLACIVLTLGMLLAQANRQTDLKVKVETRARGYRDGHAALADWLHERTTERDTIALMDIGMVGYRCIDRRVLDTSGLTDRTIARASGGFLDKQYDPAYVFDQQKAAYVVIVLRGPQSGFDITQLKPWSPTEARLINAPQLLASYHQPQRPRGDEPQLDRLAKVMGAKKVFVHDYPGDEVYLLMVYQRRL